MASMHEKSTKYFFLLKRSRPQYATIAQIRHSFFVGGLLPLRALLPRFVGRNLKLKQRNQLTLRYAALGSLYVHSLFQRNTRNITIEFVFGHMRDEGEMDLLVSLGIEASPLAPLMEVRHTIFA